MKIQEQDVYHGPALMQIVEHTSFKALNKADGQYGHYLVNTNVRLWAKYATANKGPWPFTFQPEDLAAIREDRKTKGAIHIVLTCGDHSVCCLSRAEFESLVDIDSTSQQWIRVDAPEGKQMRATGSLSRVETKVPHNRFPNCVFEG
jgi:hypothetical protein